MKSVFVLVVIFAVAAQASTPWHQLEAKSYDFTQFVEEFGRTYEQGSEEYLMREGLFNENLAAVLAHNKEGHSWKKGVNRFSDRTQAELNAMKGYSGAMKAATTFTGKAPAPAGPIQDLPTNVDWRQKGAVTSVKDQGHCGSCWTFASVETIESAWFLAKGELINLSEQQIADCTPNPKSCGGTGGCEGGTAELAFQQAIDAGGIASEWVYPYISHAGRDAPCQNITTFAATVKSYVQLPTNDYPALMNAIANVGPVAISVDASIWHAYEEGVFSGCNNTNPDIDHAVQLVGYGTDATLGDYWLVRNSWTPTWGEKGYIRIARQGPNHSCGVDLTPGDGVACKPYPKTQEACGSCGILVDSSYPIV